MTTNRRRREQRTDYKQRLALLRSRKPRMVVRKTARAVHVQFVDYQEQGDHTVVEISSRHLRVLGWHGHLANLPAAYLTGFLAGMRAKAKGVRHAVLDLGLQTSVKGSAIYACALGARDAGIAIPIGADVVPSPERITGAHIAAYAQAGEGKSAHQFKAYIKEGFRTDTMVAHFDEIKERIARERA